MAYTFVYVNFFLYLCRGFYVRIGARRYVYGKERKNISGVSSL